MGVLILFRFGSPDRTLMQATSRPRTSICIAQLLTLAGLPTEGNVGVLIPKLVTLEFDARLALAVDGRSGRTHSELAEIFTAVDAS